mmetsp:Transcript_692/g.1266  ORF Transcript_692/g.1266 Transcript_692/m.1266 type:complete len:347 (+) Transcript_692:4095-5135(+)
MELITTVAFTLFQNALECCTRKRKAEGYEVPAPKRRKVMMSVPLKHSVDYTKIALQKQTEAASRISTEQVLQDFVDHSASTGAADLASSISSLEKVTAYAKSKLRTIDPSTQSLSEPEALRSSLSPRDLSLPNCAPTDEEDRELTIMWSDPRSDEVLVTVQNVPVKFKDFRSLKYPNWLNDEVVNACVGLMPAQQGYILMNSFFYVTLAQEFMTKAVNSNKIRRILNKRGFKSSTSNILLPINLEKTHWICADVDLPGRSISIYDSLDQGTGPGYIIGEVMGRVFSKEFTVVSGNCPEQLNSCDCGVFMLTNLSLLAAGLPLVYEQRHIARMRKALAVRLARGKWL